MKRQWFLWVFLMAFIVFRYSNQGSATKESSKNSTKSTKVEQLITIANDYKGVPYGAGGTTRKGMDCSGLVNTSFKKIGVQLPRSSSAMSTKGTTIDLEEVKVGDLLFFDISRLEGGINHVGLVTAVVNNEVFFIHSTTSQGVIVSSMNETYWKKEFVKAKRVL
ncbi:C40 family peptidase [Tenacibaculum tangerinum]|uniref:C40 family peptidase n=1 Tax=Tenacibaculum tangerinum TaxID=3038772 RepID=A0ABY8LA42_9FLAO|nr:C40 family peptidase [Tenacibaculum tangerinum]WGH77023.1 C40 family peptidase [Tenacibaculum tangerinum]